SAMNIKSSFAGDGERTGDLALGVPQSGRVVKLTCGVLEAQAEQLAPGRADVLAQVRLAHVAKVLGFHPQPSSRITNLVRSGSLWPASRIASRASGSGTSASSNITRPGLTAAT